MSLTPKDSDAKVRLGYVEKDSIVWADGREKLVGRDWRKRVRELAIRCHGRCEWKHPSDNTAVGGCFAVADDPHHVIKRSVLRDDRLTNLQALCRYHHDLVDSRKTRFGEKA